MNILILLITVSIILIIALVSTLLVTKESDAVYSSEKSMNWLGLMYSALIPVIIVVELIFWFLN
ncbi:BshB3 potential contributor to bacillithiol synthesis [Paenisporosarcina sp. NPDC076898]|uniref:BshB3 potential contributor to bacillithiol synthesis n=1 Tax=unclassified Paenisporosarcina TaxID=2642018 RepID=UPI003CFF9CD5